MIRLLYLFPFIAYSGCSNITEQNLKSNNNRQVPPIKTILGVETHKLRLGKSHFYIQLPYSFKLSEARGKEGQLVYNIIPGGSTSTMSGFIEIKHGNPIGGKMLFDTPPIEIRLAPFLGGNVQWRLYKWESGYFEALTNKRRDLNASVISINRNQIDRLLSIMGTLSIE